MPLINRCNSEKDRAAGMTLIELLIVLTIIGVLSSIVYPSLTQHILKAHRNTAQADLIRLQLQLEQHYAPENETFHQGYNHALVQEGSCDICRSDIERYRITITEKQTYTLIATPVSNKGQDTDTCGTLKLNALGEMFPAECW